MRGELVKGALAGAAGVWALDRVDWFFYEREPAGVRRRTYAVRPFSLPPSHALALRAARKVGAPLTPAQLNRAGDITHYAIGILPGALYGLLSRRIPGLSFGRGAAFGAALFLLQDEWLNAATGLANRPTAYSWRTHARGLAAHLTYGIVLEAGVNLLCGPRHRRRRPEHD